MRVIVMRHGTVDYKHSRFCSSWRFDMESGRYDSAPIKDRDYSMNIPVHDVYVSSLPRSRATAERCFNGRRFIATKLIDEIPVRSAFDTYLSLPAWFWFCTGIFQWFVNDSRQPETRCMTSQRARKFVRRLLKRDCDAVVVTHGFFMHTLLSEMEKFGFKVSGKHIMYRNGEAVVAELA